MKISDDTAAVVTGGASGLGEATARAIAAKGGKVAIFDLNEDRGETVAAELGGIYCACNVADEESVIAAFERARVAHGQERILVNCAGIAPAQRTVSKKGAHDMAQFSKVIQVNLIGSFQCLSKAADGMAGAEPVNEDGERGVIISTASVAAYEGQIGQAAYAASKGGIVGMTVPVARDLAGLGIRVCTIAPGLFMTPLMASLPEEVQVSLGQQVPFPSRLGKASEYADLACHIISNAMLNGEVIRLDGAIRLAPR